MAGLVSPVEKPLSSQGKTFHYTLTDMDLLPTF